MRTSDIIGSRSFLRVSLERALKPQKIFIETISLIVNEKIEEDRSWDSCIETPVPRKDRIYLQLMVYCAFPFPEKQ